MAEVRDQVEAISASREMPTKALSILSRVAAFKMVESFSKSHFSNDLGGQLLLSESFRTIGYTGCESIYELI